MCPTAPGTGLFCSAFAGNWGSPWEDVEGGFMVRFPVGGAPRSPLEFIVFLPGGPSQ